MPLAASPTHAFVLGAVSGLRTFGALAPNGARGQLGGRRAPERSRDAPWRVRLGR